MKVKENLPDVGIIVGRFQVPKLHEAHINLVDTVLQRHEKVIIFLGLSPIHDIKDPLDFESRKRMMQEQFPNVTIAYIKDMPNDDIWSQTLDDLIQGLLTPRQTCMLYGGRDSFIKCYSGKYPTQELIQEHWISGTELRALARNQVKGSIDFRLGAIWAHHNRFPTVYTTVDIALIDQKQRKLLLGQKHQDNGLWRFPGGFADPSDLTFECSAARELTEEVPGAEFKLGPYIGSMNIDDWRYRGREDCIRTMFFLAIYTGGQCRAGDDLDEVKWFDLNGIHKKELVPNHRILLDQLKTFLAKEDILKVVGL